MSARKYSSVVPAKTLSSSVGIGDTTISLSDGTNLPTAPYTLVIDPDTVNEEIVTVVSGSYTSLTITRGTTGGDGTSAVAHSSGATVRHMLTARDVKEAQDHIEASSAYTINNPGDDSGVTSATVTHSLHGISTGEGNVVGTAKTQTLSNKSISLSTNTLTGTKADFNAALSDANFATLEGSETLTNKTLTSPTLNSPTLAGTVTIGSTALTATADELNVLDGILVSTAELNALDGLTASTAELNILDGVTATTAELNTLDGILADVNELNILNGVTATTAELNTLDGITSTVTELNLLDGVTATTAELNLTDGLGDAWTEYTPAISPGGWALGSGTWQARWKQVGKIVHVQIQHTLNGSTAGNLVISLPVEAKFNYTQPFMGYCNAGSGNYPLHWRFVGTTTIACGAINTGTSYGSLAALSTTVPGAWANGNIFSVCLTYEAA